MTLVTLALVFQCILWTPPAHAAAASADLVAKSALLPPTSSIIGTPLAAFSNDSRTLLEFTVEGEGISVIYSERDYVGAMAADNGVFVPTSTDRYEERFSAPKGRINLSKGTTNGHWGMYFPQGEENASLTMASAAALMASEPRRYGAEGIAESRPDEARTVYAQQVTVDHVSALGGGRLVYEGKGALKIFGPDIHVSDGVNAKLYRTGRIASEVAPGSDAAQQQHDAWALIEFEHARVVIEEHLPMEVALAQVQLDWSGPLVLELARGQIETAETKTRVDAEQLVLRGALEGYAVPRKMATSPFLDLSFSVSGSLDTVLGASVPIPEAPASPSGAGFGSLLAGIGMMATIVGGTTYFLFERRKSPLEVDELVHRAALGAEAEDFEDALEWTRKALHQAPASARLHADVAFFLGQLGRLEEALKEYRIASGLASDGSFDMEAAKLTLIEWSMDASVAEPFLVKGLERTPALVSEVDESFSSLRGRPRTERAIRQARARLQGP